MLWLSPDFKQNVIDMFAQLKNRRARFIFLKLQTNISYLIVSAYKS